MMKKKLELPASKIALQRAARDKGASTDYSNPNPLLSPMKRKRAPLQEGGKRKTRRKKRRKNKKRKTKKRRRNVKLKKETPINIYFKFLIYVYMLRIIITSLLMVNAIF